MNEENSSIDERFRIDQHGMDDTPRPPNARYSRRKNNGNTSMKIVVVAGVVIVFLVVGLFFLFASDDPGSPLENSEAPPVEDGMTKISLLEKRLDKLEISLAEISQKFSTIQSPPAASGTDLAVFTGRLDRVENSMSTKFNISTENIDKLDLQVAGLLDRMKNLELKKGKSISGAQVSKTQTSYDNMVQKATDKAPVSSVTPTAQTPTVKTGMKKMTFKKTAPKVIKKATPSRVYHVVKKGETLYSISKKYGTTVANIHKLNHFSKQPTIYPGDKLIVK
ncbi:LysM domain-containing protein [Desulfocicer vacuolatum DSM 3385]|uniref:LysM domain-containing protein n=1 Tax=Desulfocicer vacuolatum DSM 3385 TaxID=1121400 RepID=A0A1W2BG54_9BACT|nr:LysM domain-containing protein [Desulfocicer vacuolatum]SMC71408.1 LysM domain-containing protein [Desulfocicer vacuolatum DSM 3385]